MEKASWQSGNQNQEVLKYFGLECIEKKIVILYQF